MRTVAAVLTMAALTAAGPAAQPSVTEHEALDAFLSSVSLRHRLADVATVLGVDLNPGALLPPWARAGSPGLEAIQTSVGDDGINALVETLRRLVEAAAEPLKIEFLNLNSTNPLVQSTGYIREATIKKLSTFRLESYNFDLASLKFAVKVSFPKVDAHGYYNIDAVASGQLNVFGDGHFDVQLTQPTVEIEVQMGYGNKHFSAENLKINVKLSKLQVIMSNFLGGGEVGELVCGIVSDVGPAFLEEYHHDISVMLSTEIKDTVNALLDKMDIDTIIDWLSQGTDN